MRNEPLVCVFTVTSTLFLDVISGLTHAAYFTTGVSNNLVGGFLTNDFSGQPNTLTIKFAASISDLSFVYHQIGTQAPSNFRAMLGATLVDSFSNLSNQAQSNNYFGFTNILFDELQLDFQGDFNVDTLAYNDGAPPTTIYCTAKLNSLGCMPAIVSSGDSSVSANFGFVISAANVLNNKPGLLLYGLDGPGALPFQGGILCIAPPLHRAPAVNSGGTPATLDCSGVLSIDMNAFAAGALGGSPGPELLVPGSFVNCQWWSRDNGFAAPLNTSLSDGLGYIVGN